jgi:hypothetical protein
MAQSIVNTWNNLPDPRDPKAPRGAKCRVIVAQSAWEHITKDHVCDTHERTFWEEWLTSDVVGKLVKACQGHPLHDTQNRTESDVGTRVEPMIRAAMERPLVMTHRCMQQNHAYNWAMWTLVLPNGALVHLQPYKKSTARMRTCFFPHELVRGRPCSQWWQASVEMLVKRYAKIDVSGFWVLPDTRHTVKVRDYKSSCIYLHYKICFVTSEEWGFSKGNRGAMWMSRNVRPWPALLVQTTPALLDEFDRHKLPHRPRIN